MSIHEVSMKCAPFSKSSEKPSLDDLDSELSTRSLFVMSSLMKGKSIMKKVFALTFVALLLTGLVYFLPVASATAHASTLASHSQASSSIVTGPCNNSSFLDIYSPINGDTCFANDGYIGFRIQDAEYIHAGNNSGWVMCYGSKPCSSGGTKFYFLSYNNYTLPDVLITQVDITGAGE